MDSVPLRPQLFHLCLLDKTRVEATEIVKIHSHNQETVGETYDSTDPQKRTVEDTCQDTDHGCCWQARDRAEGTEETAASLL